MGSPRLAAGPGGSWGHGSLQEPQPPALRSALAGTWAGGCREPLLLPWLLIALSLGPSRLCQGPGGHVNPEGARCDGPPGSTA